MEFNNNIPEWNNEGTAPSEELKTKGFVGGYKPPASVFNYMFNQYNKCIGELQDKLTASEIEVENLLATIENKHRINMYVSLADIELSSGSETIEGIAINLPNNSELLINVGAESATIYPQTYGVLHVIKKDNTRIFFEFYTKTNAWRYYGVYDSTMTEAWSGWQYSLHSQDVIDSLTSTDIKYPLSAKQGKVLNDNLTSHTNNTSNPHSVTKDQIGLGNVPNVATNDQTPTYSDTTNLETLSSGEKINVAFQKIKCAITNLINHINTHKVNNYVSLIDIALSAGSETIEDIAENLPSNSELLLTIGSSNAPIYPQTYGVLKVTKKDGTRTIFEFYSKTTAYKYLGIYDSTMTNPWSGWVYSLGQADVIDSLTSTSTNMPLSANQGKVLNDKVDTLEAKIPVIQAGTTDLTAGTSELASGTIYCVYE